MKNEKKAQTWEQLADALQVTRRSLSDWRGKYPDAPKMRGAEDWRAFMKARGLQCYSLRQNMPCPPSESAQPSLLGSLIAELDIAKARVIFRLELFPPGARNQANAALTSIMRNVSNLYELAGIP